MNKTWILVLWVMCSLLIGCKSEYEQLVKSELASGILHEDLFFGLKMGQKQKEFFQICWDLNKQKIISQGPKNEYVRYEMNPNEIPNEPEKVEMLFYGIFDEEKVMRGVRKRFSYLAWSLWNKEFHSNKLAEKLKDYYLQTYGGNDFIEIDEGIKEISTYVKVDGNRQILIYPADTKDVVVKIEDTRYKLSKQ